MILVKIEEKSCHQVREFPWGIDDVDTLRDMVHMDIIIIIIKSYTMGLW